ncbi:unnamed protein product [Linum tenue]|uniref:DCD domain-containing protein n=1 Tax=Linum tenue TaxID=586396 RepID=A0AAV0KRZ1_9ROSI|nr:unnamed protein product [Linum tenue]
MMRVFLLGISPGLPATHFAYVKNIDAGLPLFLFNYSDRKLYGIFFAACPGQMNIDPYGWTDGSERTAYPAQVRIQVKQQCQPLLEGQFKPVIADNYYNDKHFYFELDHGQTQRLMALLSFSPLPSGASFLPYSAKVVPTYQYRPVRKNKEETDEFEAVKFEADQTLSESSSISDKRDVDEEFTPLASEIKNHNPSGNPHDGDAYSTSVSEIQLKEAKVVAEVVGGKGEEALIFEKLRQLSLNSAPKESSSESSFEVSGAANHSLTQALEELKTFSSKQALKVSQLEKKLVAADVEIQRLKDHCFKLDGTPSAPITNFGKIAQTAPDDLHLDLGDSIYIIGGHDGKTWLSSLDLYLPSTGQRESLSPMSCVRAYASVAELYGNLYVMGGGDGNLWYDTVESYNQGSNRWTSSPSLSKKKGSLASASISDKIYAFGGGNGQESFSDVEMLDFDVGRWIQARSMLQKRFALAAVELNGALYATGGFDGNVYLKSCERFDPREHSWIRITDMNEIRASHSLVALNDKIYALGGSDGDNMVSSTEMYDPRNGSWIIQEPMKKARAYSAAVVVKEAIFVFGGVEAGATITDTVEYFKDGEGWQEHKTSTIGKRSFMSAMAA